MQVRNRSPVAQLVQFSLGAANLARLPGPGQQQQQADASSSDAAAAGPLTASRSLRVPLSASLAVDRTSMLSSTCWQPLGAHIDPGIVLLGQLERCRCRVAPDATHTLRMAVLFAEPGLYQLHVCDVLATAAAAGQQQLEQEQGEADWVAAGRVYVNVQRLNVLCL